MSTGGAVGETSPSRFKAADSHALAKLGKQQVLKRRFGYLTIFGFSCTILVTWETVLTLFPLALENGGPAGLVWGFLIAWLCSLSVYTCLSEMASLAPIAGGQYFWVAILAPPSQRRFLSYVTGWLTTLAWISTLAVGIIYAATIVQGVIVLNHADSYVPEPWQTTLISWAIIAVSLFINTVVAGVLPLFEGAVLIIHVAGFVAILTTLVYLSPHGTADEVFFTSSDGGNWPTRGLSYCAGFIGNVATFVGADAAVHMAEEIENAAVNVPRAIFSTVILNGCTGFGMAIALMFCLGDADAVLNSATGMPFVQVFANAAGVAGGTGMTVVILLLTWASLTGFLATCSRMVWSFARDEGLPFHAFLSRVDSASKVPNRAAAVVTIVPCLLTLIYVGSPTAYNDVISLSVCGLYGSYLISCACLLWRRITGQIRDRRAGSSEEQVSNVFIDPMLEWGPWHVPGWLGIINNGFACIYALFVLFWDFWPPATPDTAATMNYSVVVLGGVVLFAVAYYVGYGRFHYKGPLIDYEVRGMANRALVVGAYQPAPF